MQIETSIHIRYQDKWNLQNTWFSLTSISNTTDLLWFTSVILNCAHNYNLKQLPLSTVKTAFTLRAALCSAALRSAALIDYVVINGSIHTGSRAAQHMRIKFETRAIRAAKCRAALRSTALIMHVTWAMMAIDGEKLIEVVKKREVLYISTAKSYKDSN